MLRRRGYSCGSILPWLLGLVLVGCGSPTGDGEGPALRSPPNIVLVIVDTVRSDHLSCYGYQKPTSPNLEQLASQGLVFVNSFATSTWTLPSVATLLTGLLPDQHGLKSTADRLSEEIETVAERLQACGYQTAAFTDGGFLDPLWGFAQGFNRYETTAGEAWDPKDVSAIEAQASAWLRENPHEPYFLLVHTYEAHQPYRFRPGFSEKFLGDDELEPGVEEILAWDIYRSRGESDFLRRGVALYDGEIARADHYVGRLIQTLRETGGFDDTAIIVTSDHGEEFLEHGGVEHGTGKVFDENLRVPLIVKLPGVSKEARIETPVSGVDLAPTILRIAGLDVPGSFAGQSVLARAVSEVPRRRVFAHGLNSFPEIDEERYRLDSDRWSLVFDSVRDQVSVFDLESDPLMRAAQPSSAPLGDDDLIARLQYILAWCSGRTRHVMRLPAGSTELFLSRQSSVTSAVLWEGLVSEPLEVGVRRRLSPDVAYALAFDLEPSADTLRFKLAVAASPRRESFKIRIAAASQPAADPLPIHGPVPPPLVIVTASRVYEPLGVQIDSEAAEELRALGYLQ